MSVLYDKENKELIVTCCDKCGNAIHLSIDSFKDNTDYCFLSLMSGTYYQQQDNKILKVIGTKLKKIWYIIRNKDYCYSEIIMDAKEYESFKSFVNDFQLRG